MERPSVIHKTASDQRPLPHWTDYEGERRAYSWDAARCALQGLPGGGLNIGFEAVDRHAATALRERTALRFVSRSGPARDLSYGELARQTNRFANVLQGLGVTQGERLFVLAGRIPELNLAAVLLLKAVALVGFGSLAARPWVQDGQLGVQPVLCATLAADHRASDGHRGALFLVELREWLQWPQALADTGAAHTTSQGVRHDDRPRNADANRFDLVAFDRTGAASRCDRTGAVAAPAGRSGLDGLAQFFAEPA